MLKRLLFAVFILVVLTTPAFAFYCPLNVKAIDGNMAKRTSAPPNEPR